MIVPIDARAGMRIGYTAQGTLYHLIRPDSLPVDRTYGTPRFLTLCGRRAFRFGSAANQCSICRSIAGSEAP